MFSHKIKWYPLFESRDELEALFVLRKAVVYRTMFAEALLVKDGEEYFAFRNRCPHQHKPLDNCRIDDGHVVCPFHQYHFSLENGRGHELCLDKYQLRFDDTGVWLGIEKWSWF